MNNLIRLIARRLIALPIMALGVTILVFFLMSFSKIDPAYNALGESATPEAVAQYHKEFGLDDPVPVRYVRYMTGLLQGDLGTYGAARCNRLARCPLRCSLRLLDCSWGHAFRSSLVLSQHSIETTGLTR